MYRYRFSFSQRVMIVGLLTAILGAGDALAQRGGDRGRGGGGGRGRGGGGGASRSFSGGGGPSRSFSRGGGQVDPLVAVVAVWVVRSAAVAKFARSVGVAASALFPLGRIASWIFGTSPISGE